MIHASVHWQCGPEPFAGGRYRRAHTWKFDQGIEVPASSSPDIVPVPLSDPQAVDPEEAYVASLSSCHMLWFLAIAEKAGFEVQDYRDHASGEMNTNEDGKRFISSVTLKPEISWVREPTSEQIRQMHHQAHEECFIANSVRTSIEVVIE